MKTKENEILLFYNSNKQTDKEIKGYAESAGSHKLNDRDVSKANLTERQLAEVASDLGVAVNDLLDKHDEKYMSDIKGGNYSDDELLKLMKQNPSLIKTPIAYMDGKTFFVDSQYRFVKEDIDIEGVKSDKGNEFEK
ncbi:hypothetical protein E1176_03175 [Fulvivirga sp. RKSG066]|uniref:arsenate reductase family protein n=1 Tax=Fulvivirga aurantia TaxID=2529383 RepID=UPI0012BB4D8A|nr:ArsC/Spx/MgsR family protein [Fulvivirga aurantia]MTI20015.1 hypothetical protein [Fulvivirga aurantia]